VLPGFWLPRFVEVSNYHVAETGQDYQVSRDHIETSEWKVNEELETSRFELPHENIDNIGEPVVAPAEPTAGSGKRPASDEAAYKQNAAPGFRKMLIKTVDEQESPVPGVRIFVNIWPDGPYKDSKRNYTADEQGRVSVLVPSPPRLFRIWTQKEGYVPLFAQWWPEHQPDGSQIPEEFTFSLPRGTEIGGAIVDDDGAPIEGAVVEVALGNRVDEMGRRPVPSMWLSEVPGPGNNSRITDMSGRWSLDNVPAGEEIFVRVKVTHPDYISDTRWGGLQEEQAITMTAFRDKSATIAMHRGVVLTGRVTGAEGQPIPNAVVVWGDDPYFEEGTQEVRTDQGGAYRLQPLSPGKVNVTVVAEGWSPASKTVDVIGSAISEDFQLEKGNRLRIHFVDENENAVPNVSVSIQSWRGSKALYNHRHPNVLNTQIPTKSDDKGIFTWEWGPHDDVDYAFYKDDYRPLDQTLAADGDVHTVKMLKEAR